MSYQGNSQTQTVSQFWAGAFQHFDAYGNATESLAGNGLTHWRSYDARTRLVESITTSGGVQALDYSFDGLGNLRSRSDNLHRLPALSGSGIATFDETFFYDDLNRLTQVRQQG
ncbi:hypothetical protein [Aliidiomarina celeris]|uniref:hypothetical protein n=1 Tax=Aliidiomarina celeris TaxID=2249428 RepID=UPI000DE93442|nr:hypothetical protein [Aliidiomarina celeris]